MTIFQKPNLLLILAGVGYVISYVSEGIITHAAETLFYMTLTTWAYEEATTGTNKFRKLLGFAVLALMAVSLFRKISGM